MNTPRIPPKPIAEFDDGLKQAFGNFISGDKLYNVFATLAHHSDLVKGWVPFITHILTTSTLSARDREVLILRIGWLCQSKYEFVQHVLVGQLEGLSDQEIQQIKTGPDAEGISEHDSTLLRAVDELHSQANISDAVWQQLAGFYSQQQIMDVVFTVGNYNMIAMALNSFGVDLEDDIAAFAPYFEP